MSRTDTEYLQAPRLQKLGSMLELAPLALKWLDHPRHSFQHCDLFVLKASMTWRLHILPWRRSLSWTHPAAWPLYEVSGSWMLWLYIGAITNSHFLISNRVGEAFWLRGPPRERERAREKSTSGLARNDRLGMPPPVICYQRLFPCMAYNGRMREPTLYLCVERGIIGYQFRQISAPSHIKATRADTTTKQIVKKGLYALVRKSWSQYFRFPTGRYTYHRVIHWADQFPPKPPL